MKNLEDFVFESNKIEGYHRVLPWELEAHKNFLALDKISIADLEHFVGTIAPGHILRRRLGYDVQVGDYIAPLGGPIVVHNLGILLADIDEGLSPYDAHVQYENLHPFTDGNGRSGRALYYWMKEKTGLNPLRYRSFLHDFYYETLRNSDARFQQ